MGIIAFPYMYKVLKGYTKDQRYMYGLRNGL